MRVVFRVDANGQIGSGHAMRCLALAAALATRGAECNFLMRDDGASAVAEQISGDGFRVTTLPAPEDSTNVDGLAHSHFLPGGQAFDAGVSLKAMQGERAELLVADHYGIDHRWQDAMRSVARRILVIDDLADRRHSCDLLLDQNHVAGFETRYDRLVPDNCQKMLGPRYALLRPEFERHGLPVRKWEDGEPRLLVMYGGSDPENLTLRTIRLLVDMGWSGGVDVVAGPLHGDPEGLRKAMASLPDAVLHAPARDVAMLMCGAGLSVGSPGVSSWERSAMALPSITLSQAFNQEAIGLALGEAGAALHLGRAADVHDTMLEAALRLLGGNPPARRAMARVAASICDGRGMRRVVDRLMPRTLSIRRARRSDGTMLFSWRNDPRTRRHSHDPRELVLPEHLDWLDSMLARRDSDLLIAGLDGEEGAGQEASVACVRFDRVGDRAMVSIYLDPQRQGEGLGLSALRAALDWLAHTHPEIHFTDADVRAGNEASHRLFTAAGFRLDHARYVRPQD